MAYKRKNPKTGVKEVEGIVCGRTGAVIPPAEVAKLASYHCTNDEIAHFYGITRATLENNFRDIIEMNRAITSHKLRKKQLEVAMSGDRTMLIWLGKILLGQSENQMVSSDDKILPWIGDDND